ncbi:MAG: hypothetical protein NTV43_06020 [Methylococcales bacterium]|nr:hypothetical protein [Methylococcales bacterium]
MASENRNTCQNFWRQHLTQWQGSGLSLTNYCCQQALPDFTPATPGLSLCLRDGTRVTGIG